MTEKEMHSYRLTSMVEPSDKMLDAIMSGVAVMADALYINPDNIAQETFGDWNSPTAILKAAQVATEERYRCLAEKKDFVFETVLSSEEKLQFLKKAHESGFFIRLFFVCTNSPEINVMRITKRVLDGGHEVPITKII